MTKLQIQYPSRWVGQQKHHMKPTPNKRVGGLSDAAFMMLLLATRTGWVPKVNKNNRIGDNKGVSQKE